MFKTQFFIFVLFILTPFFLLAQKTHKKVVLDACTCMEAISMDAAKTDRDRAVEACVQNAVLDNRAEIDKDLGVGLEELNQDEGRKFITEISDRLVGECDAFAALIQKNIKPKKIEEVSKPSKSQFREVTKKGILVSVENKNHTYLFFKDKKGLEHQLLLFSYFEGAEDFIRDLSYLVGKDVEITWNEKRVYDPIEKRYGREKEISGVKQL